MRFLALFLLHSISASPVPGDVSTSGNAVNGRISDIEVAANSVAMMALGNSINSTFDLKTSANGKAAAAVLSTIASSSGNSVNNVTGGQGSSITSSVGNSQTTFPNVQVLPFVPGANTSNTVGTASITGTGSISNSLGNTQTSVGGKIDKQSTQNSVNASSVGNQGVISNAVGTVINRDLSSEQSKTTGPTIGQQTASNTVSGSTAGSNSQIINNVGTTSVEEKNNITKVDNHNYNNRTEQSIVNHNNITMVNPAESSSLSKNLENLAASILKVIQEIDQVTIQFHNGQVKTMSLSSGAPGSITSSQLLIPLVFCFLSSLISLN